MDKNVFIKQLFVDSYQKGKQAEIYGELLSKIFCDVYEYEDVFNKELISVQKKFNGMYISLGQYFKEHKTHGIMGILPEQIITHCGLVITLYDERFEVRDIDENVYLKYQSLMKPEYQKRYVNEMYKMFGEDYKKQYKMIMREHEKEDDEEAKYLQ